MTTHHDPRNCDCAAHRSHSFLALADERSRAEKAEKERDERDAWAQAWKEHSRHLATRVRSLKAVNEAWDANFTAAINQREDAWEQLEHRDGELATAEAHRDEAQCLAAEQIAEAQTEATEAVTRAETAELRAEKAEASSKYQRERAEEAERLLVKAETAQPRSLTADDLLAHFPVDRRVGDGVAVICRCRHESWARNHEVEGPIDNENNTWRAAERRHMEHALTPPPKRPESAEDYEFLIADRIGGDVTADVIRALADEVAERASTTRLYPGAES